MAGYRDIELTETERTCGVSKDTAIYLAGRAHKMPDGRIVVETIYGPAVAGASARMVNRGSPVVFLGINSMGHSVYRSE